MMNRMQSAFARRERLSNLVLYLLVPLAVAALAWFQVTNYLHGRPSASAGIQEGGRPAVIPRGKGFPTEGESLGTAELHFSSPASERHYQENGFLLRGGTLFLGSCGWMVDMPPQLFVTAYVVEQGGSRETGSPEQGAAVPGMMQCEGNALLPTPFPELIRNIPARRRIVV